ncbi:Anaphase-promoting complex subunit 3 [Sparassis crispa]|uniref:Anaphase-promoting complex subunit 3 n=1 Tax=Sparassis crispa TaxID=139825 RepID=A0A401GJZ5_9APHY|nr:Anaphase-promoting complex subunit 3 [Sparassis crispa]GBE82491.1 Anaphase-promoting complex subunit 3 [Sparassis crispa]
MQQEGTSSPSPRLCHRFNTLIWSCLDVDLYKSALFYAERYFVLDTNNHDARHLYATALLRSGQPHSAHFLVNLPTDIRCSGCFEIKAKCCTALGRHRQAREALEESMRGRAYTPAPSMSSRTVVSFPEEAVLHCRSGNMALKGNLPENAAVSFHKALALNPMLWEAFEGLCMLGRIPEIDELFPPRPPPIKQIPPDGAQTKVPIPVATGAGFFTPDVGGGGNLFRAWKPEISQPQPFRLDQALGSRDSIASADSSLFPEASFVQGSLRPSRSQPMVSLAVQPPAVRPLSSADEAGPVTKKLRSGVRQRTAPPSTNAADSNTNLKPSKSAGALLLGAADRMKSSKTTATSSRLHATGAKGGREQQPPVGAATRRSTRLLGGGNSKTLATKHSTLRDRRRVHTRVRSRSIESDMDEEPGGPLAFTPPPPIPQSPPEAPAGPSVPSAAQEQAAQDLYDAELADYHIYELMRSFARAGRAMALYDCHECLEHLEKLPSNHQRSAWVMAMVGKAHYELGEYVAAERAFEAVRNLEPYRLTDMEVYSTLLWHLQRNVKLSFLAQELLSTDPRSPQAWIAVGNCFSLLKERAQALTCFQRAAQLDPACAYAYTLSGHETIDQDLDKAINFFESALRADARHYNAWYGLGSCYMRMSKLRLADYHYRRAAQIHPQNAVLLGCVGMVHQRCGEHDKALKLFDEAVSLSPENALVRYRRAKVLISLRRYKLAVEDLEYLRDTSPEESNVIFQLAKVYRLLGDELKSAQTLAVARDVSPKSVNKIRKLLETVKDTRSEEEVMDVG